MGNTKESSEHDDVGGGYDGKESIYMQLGERQARVRVERDLYRPRAPPVRMYSSFEMARRRERANGKRPAASSVDSRRQAVKTAGAVAGNLTRRAAGSWSSGGGYETVEASGKVFAENAGHRRPRVKAEGATQVVEASGGVSGASGDRCDVVEASGKVAY